MIVYTVLARCDEIGCREFWELAPNDHHQPYLAIAAVGWKSLVDGLTVKTYCEKHRSDS